MRPIQETGLNSHRQVDKKIGQAGESPDWNGECLMTPSIEPAMRTVTVNCSQPSKLRRMMELLRIWVRAIPIAAAALLICVLGVSASSAAGSKEQVCDITADYALGLEDYPAAIALHQKFIRSHPDDALAHYHLGFAYGMTGRLSDETREYVNAVRLGLRQWDLYLDLGLAYLEQRDYSRAVNALETSVLLEPEHPEAHFNLALAYEQAGRLRDAMREIVTSLRMAPADPDIRNTKAIICSELGDLRCAHDEWALLSQIAPNYAPARANLAILMGATSETLSSNPDTAETPQLLESASWSNDKQVPTPFHPGAFSVQSRTP
jgi:Flp pilus assembly protein TadD